MWNCPRVFSGQDNKISFYLKLMGVTGITKSKIKIALCWCLPSHRLGDQYPCENNFCLQYRARMDSSLTTCHRTVQHLMSWCLIHTRSLPHNSTKKVIRETLISYLNNSCHILVGFQFSCIHVLIYQFCDASINMQGYKFIFWKMHEFINRFK